jgi:aspartate/methionine/tyrosine aminotransferase
MKRYEKLSSFRVMDILTEGRRYDDTVHFEVGQPDLPPPPGVNRAMIEAAKNNRFQYTESMGILPLRQKISAHYQHEYGLDIDPERIVVTPGSSVAFMVAYLLLLESGERIALADPSYPCYKNFAHMVDAEPVFIPAGKEEGYILKPSMIEKRGIKALHISSPGNPTGRIYDAQSLNTLARCCEDEGIGFVCDELYHGLVYSGETHSVLEYSDRAIVVNGFSKPIDSI